MRLTYRFAIGFEESAFYLFRAEDEDDTEDDVDRGVAEGEEQTGPVDDEPGRNGGKAGETQEQQAANE